jgi:glycine/D-amino acid oxidase-like deaminating enzyme
MTARSDGADMRERPRLSFDLDVDICVVGAGLAGLTVALEAARLGASVAVLEGRHVGWNAYAGLWSSDRRSDRPHRS